MRASKKLIYYGLIKTLLGLKGSITVVNFRSIPENACTDFLIHALLLLAYSQGALMCFLLADEIGVAHTHTHYRGASSPSLKVHLKSIDSIVHGKCSSLGWCVYVKRNYTKMERWNITINQGLFCT